LPTDVVFIHWHGPGCVVNLPLSKFGCLLEEAVGAEQQPNDDNCHNDEEKEKLEILGVVCLGLHLFYYLAKFAAEALAALAVPIHTHRSVCALSGAVFDAAAENLDVGTHILQTSCLSLPLDLESAVVTGEVIW